MSGIPTQVLERLFHELHAWASLWRVPGLEKRVTIHFSRRLKTSLGRCFPTKGEIRLASFLLEGPSELLHEVVCHEAAHAAAYELHGNYQKPHGRQWQELVRAAGFEPKASIRVDALHRSIRAHTRPSTLWEHRCPVCQASRVARRPVRSWRCVACLTAGLEGKLLVKRLVTGAVFGD